DIEADLDGGGRAHHLQTSGAEVGAHRPVTLIAGLEQRLPDGINTAPPQYEAPEPVADRWWIELQGPVQFGEPGLRSGTELQLPAGLIGDQAAAGQTRSNER